MIRLVMVRRWKENSRFRAALLVSLALHGLAALFLPLLAPATQPSPDTLETISYQRALHVALQRHAATPHTRAAPASKPVAVKPRSVQRRAVTPARKAAASKQRARATAPPTSGATVAARDFSVGVPSAPPAAATSVPVAAKTAPLSNAQPSSAPAARSQTREVPNAEGAGARSGIGMFGEVQDPALAGPVMAELQHRFKLKVTLIVTVGDDGKTKQIEFHPPVTPSVENQIRTLLADANWDPALCGGGIACEGKATIKLSE